MRLHTVTVNGREFRLGNNPPASETALQVKWPVYGGVEETPLVPRAAWKPISLRPVMPQIKDQDGVGACNAFATCSIVEACRAFVGLPPVRLSPGYLYGNINGQRDEGSLLEDALRWMADHGTCTADTVPELAWRKRDWPPHAAAEAAHFRVAEAFLCPTFDHIASALQRGFFVNMGVAWHEGDSPDPDGWLPESPRGQWGGHAIAGCGLVKRGSQWGIQFANSWGEGWGAGGFGILPERRFQGPIGGWWAVRAVTFPEQGDVPLPQNGGA
jgi:hypothetical protein